MWTETRMITKSIILDHVRCPLLKEDYRVESYRLQNYALRNGFLIAHLYVLVLASKPTPYPVYVQPTPYPVYVPFHSYETYLHT